MPPKRKLDATSPEAQRGRPAPGSTPTSSAVVNAHPPILQNDKPVLLRCTYCPGHKNFTIPHQWKRHEEQFHCSQDKFTCMKHGPIWHDGSCVLCREPNVDGDHPSKCIHDVGACEPRPSYYRQDQLRAHMRTIHHMARGTYGIKEEGWREPSEKANEWYDCGYCEKREMCWENRCEHIRTVHAVATNVLDPAIDWRKCRCTRGYSPDLVPFLKHFAVYIDFPCIMKRCCTALVGTAICGAVLINGVAICGHDDLMYGQALSSRKFEFPVWLGHKPFWCGICKKNRIAEYEGSYDCARYAHFEEHVKAYPNETWKALTWKGMNEAAQAELHKLAYEFFVEVIDPDNAWCKVHSAKTTRFVTALVAYNVTQDVIPDPSIASSVGNRTQVHPLSGQTQHPMVTQPNPMTGASHTRMQEDSTIRQQGPLISQQQGHPTGQHQSSMYSGMPGNPPGQHLAWTQYDNLFASPSVYNRAQGHPRMAYGQYPASQQTDPIQHARMMSMTGHGHPYPSSQQGNIMPYRANPMAHGHIMPHRGPPDQTYQTPDTMAFAGRMGNRGQPDFSYNLQPNAMAIPGGMANHGQPNLMYQSLNPVAMGTRMASHGQSDPHYIQPNPMASTSVQQRGQSDLNYLQPIPMASTSLQQRCQLNPMHHQPHSMASPSVQQHGQANPMHHQINPMASSSIQQSVSRNLSSNNAQHDSALVGQSEVSVTPSVDSHNPRNTSSGATQLDPALEHPNSPAPPTA